jgi:hypothetical protein
MAFDFPSSPTIGQQYPTPPVANQPVYTWDGQKWTSGTGYGAIYVSDSAPAAPVGSLWWNSTTGVLFIRYNDGNSTQWVAIAGGGADAVLYATVQALTAAQQAQARQNIGIKPSTSVLIFLNANQSIPNSVATDISLTTAARANASIWTASAPTRLIVPPGVTQVRLSGKITFANNASGSRYLSFPKNGSTSFAGYPEFVQLPGSNTWDFHTVSAILDVTPGDYFTMNAYQNSTGALAVIGDAVGVNTWASLEVVQ